MKKSTTFERWNNYMREQNESAEKDHEEKLLPCPFCGEDAELEDWRSGYESGTTIRCTVCDVCVSWGVENGDGWHERAVKKWNRRAKPEQQEAVHGKWIAMTDYPGTYSQCSCCGQKARGYTPNMKYCPNCGAKMEAR